MAHLSLQIAAESLVKIHWRSRPPVRSGTNDSVSESPLCFRYFYWNPLEVVRTVLQRRFLLTVFCAAGAFFFISSNASSAANKKEEVKNQKMLTVRTQSVSFTLDSKFSALGIHNRTKTGNSLWRVSKPEVVCLINPENKSYLEIPVEEYLENEVHMGRKARRFTSMSNPVPSMENGHAAQRYTLFSTRGGSQDKVADIICVKQNCVPKKVVEMWCKMFGIGRTDLGFPVGLLSESNLRNRRHTRLESAPTFSLKTLAETPLDKGIFEVPKDLKPAPDKASLYFSLDGNFKNSDMDEIFRYRPKK